MNRSILGTITLAAIAVGAPAFAADLAVKAPVYKAPPPPPPFSWAGFYTGASVGAIWANDKIADLDGLNLAQTYSLKDTGVIGSGVIGYNFQYLQFVYGIEADLGGLGLSKTISEPNSGTPPVTTNHLGSGFYSDVTARLGYAFDRALVYAKGGWAYYEGTANVNNTLGGFGGGVASTSSFTGGWTVGGGVEYAFAPAWSAKVEYLHFDFGNQTATLVTPANGNFRFSNDLTADAVTVGVTYHFGH
jgi:outer membrane immunogenic protein